MEKPSSIIQDISTDIAEVGIDLLIESDLLEAIPILSTLSKTAKLATSIKEHIFLKRIQAFLVSANDLNPKLIQDFSERLADENEKVEFGERLVTLIDQSDSKQKAAILGILFQRLVKNEIDRYQFDHLGFCVTRLYSIDLYHLAHAGGDWGTTTAHGISLATYGLADNKIDQSYNVDLKQNQVSGVKYIINDSGKILAETMKQYMLMVNYQP